MPSLADETVQATIITALSAASGAAHERRVGRFDQLAADAASMWANALTNPTVNSGLGYRTVVESGAGRTRAETNNPGNTAAPNIQAG